MTAVYFDPAEAGLIWRRPHRQVAARDCCANARKRFPFSPREKVARSAG